MLLDSLLHPEHQTNRQKWLTYVCAIVSLTFEYSERYRSLLTMNFFNASSDFDINESQFNNVQGGRHLTHRHQEVLAITLSCIMTALGRCVTWQIASSF